MSVLKIKDESTGEFIPIPSIKGDTGEAAGFGTVSATVDANHGTPSVTVTASGDDTAKNFAFEFKNLQPAPYDDSVLVARMDSFTNLAEGSTTGDAELIDGRTGADGVTYTNIGGAIRGQVTDLKSEINNLDSKLLSGVINTKLSQLDLSSGLYTQFGVYQENSEFSYAFIPLDNTTVTTVDHQHISDSVVINVCNAAKAFKRNVGAWVSGGITTISNYQSGDAYICVSAKNVDLAKVIIGQDTDGVIPMLRVDLEEDIATLENSKYPSVNMNGGWLNNEPLTDVVEGAYIDQNGNIISHSDFCYGFCALQDCNVLRVSQQGISDTTVINLMDSNKQFVKAIRAWVGSGVYDITAIPFNAKYVAISCQKVDLPLISVSLNLGGYLDVIDSNESDALRVTNAYGELRRRDNFIKGLHLDCARKYFSVANIKRLIDSAQSANLNTFQIYFSDDNGFRFGLNNMTIEVDGQTYDLSSALGDGLSPTDGSDKWLTESEMDEIIAYANGKGLDVIPAFDMPGHIGAIRAVFTDSSQFWLNGEHGYKFLCAIIDKYAKYFANKGCRYYNICGDETSATNEQYTKFMRMAFATITRNHMMPMLYNDMICKNGYYDPHVGFGCYVLNWTHHADMSANSVLEKIGYKIINANMNLYYWILGGTITTQELLERIRTSNIFTLYDWDYDYNAYGVMYHIWCDQADQDGADDGNNVVTQTLPCIEAFGEAVERCVPMDSKPSTNGVQSLKDMECLKNGDGLILRSENGIRFKLTISDNGQLNIIGL